MKTILEAVEELDSSESSGAAKAQGERNMIPISRKFEEFLFTTPATPFLAMDLDVVDEKYRELESYFPDASIFYAVKANPANEIVARLARMGSSFDVASTVELDACLSLGVAASRVSYGNTIKKSADIAHAHSRGVRLFVFGSHLAWRQQREMWSPRVTLACAGFAGVIWMTEVVRAAILAVKEQFFGGRKGIRATLRMRNTRLNVTPSPAESSSKESA